MVGAHPVGEQILGLPVAQGGEPLVIKTLSVPHHGGRGTIEPLYQQSAFLVDGQVEGACDACSATVSQPGLCRREQAVEYGRVVHGFEHSKVT
ncbi:hypothetical protein D3C81_1823440 [compost metagenome]